MKERPPRSAPWPSAAIFVGEDRRAPVGGRAPLRAGIEVIEMIGIFSVAGFRRGRSIASPPFINGIVKSVATRSGILPPSIRPTATWPFGASPLISGQLERDSKQEPHARLGRRRPRLHPLPPDL